MLYQGAAVELRTDRGQKLREFAELHGLTTGRVDQIAKGRWLRPEVSLGPRASRPTLRRGCPPQAR